MKIALRPNPQARSNVRPPPERSSAYFRSVVDGDRKSHAVERPITSPFQPFVIHLVGMIKQADRHDAPALPHPPCRKETSTLVPHGTGLAHRQICVLPIGNRLGCEWPC